jgi:hypothetical protein
MEKVYSFGMNLERGEYWHTNEEGIRTPCTEKDYHRMKIEWVTCVKKSRNNVGKSTIYNFEEPMKIQLGEMRGGKREGAGMKPKYGEETAPIAIRVPKSRVREFRDFVNEKLKEWEVNK